MLQGQAELPALHALQEPGPAAAAAAAAAAGNAAAAAAADDADESMMTVVSHGADEHPWQKTITAALATPLPANHTLRGVRTPNERNASFSISVRACCGPCAPEPQHRAALWRFAAAQSQTQALASPLFPCRCATRRCGLDVWAGSR